MEYISSLHVGIICGFLVFLLSAMGVARTRWILCLGPLLIAYTFATGAKPSAVRACIMALIYFGAPFAGRRADTLSALSLAALLIVAVCPRQLFDPGFIMSFSVVLGLIVLYPLVHGGLEAALIRIGILTGAGTAEAPPLFWEADPAQVQAEGKWRLAVRNSCRWALSLFALSCSAWLVSTPLTAYYFGRCVPVALAGNMVVIPLAFLIVLGGCASLVLGSMFSLFAEVFNHANHVLVSLLVESMRVMSAVPGGSLLIPKPPLWAVGLWYAVLAAGVWLSVERRRKANNVDKPAIGWNDDAD